MLGAVTDGSDTDLCLHWDEHRHLRSRQPAFANLTAPCDCKPKIFERYMLRMIFANGIRGNKHRPARLSAVGGASRGRSHPLRLHGLASYAGGSGRWPGQSHAE